jgi:DNA-binding CsgD family transcriptional regulator
MRGTPAPPAAVVRWAPQAAHEAGVRGARREAAAHCRAALAHLDRLDEPARAALLDEYASHCFELNDLAAAIPAREQAIALFARSGDAAREAEALAAQALSLVRALRNADADATSQRALALVEAMQPGRHRAQAYATESYLRMLNRDLDDAVRWGEQAIALAERFDDRATLAGAYKTVGAALMFVDYARGLRLRPEEPGDRAHAGRRRRRRRRRLRDAVDRVGRGARVRRRRALPRRGHRPRARARPRPPRRLHGELAGAVRHLPRPLAARRRARPRGRRAGGGGDDQSRRRPGRARPPAQPARRSRARSTCSTRRSTSPCARTRCSAWRRSPQRAPKPRGSKGEATTPVARPTASSPWRRRSAIPGSRASSRSGAGARAAIRGRSTSARRRFACRSKGAGATRRRRGRRWAARTSGRARLADGDEAAQREALAVLDRLGAVPLAERVRRGMRSAGVRSVPRGALAATRGNAAGLTARELQVLELVAAGCRNADIAARLSRSARTVEHHLESILAKLGVDSRVDAVAAARRLGVLAKNG